MRFVGLLDAAVLLVAAAGLYAVSLGGELGAPAVAALTATCAVGALLPRRRRAVAAWGRAVNWLAVLLLGLQVVRGILGAAPLQLGLEFAAALQASRLLTRHRSRDYQQIVVLALVHLIAGTVLTAELVYAALFVVFALAAPQALALAHLHHEIELDAERRGPEGAAHLERTLAARGLVGGRFLAGTALLVIPIFSGTLVLFAFFPRVGAGFLTREGRRGAPVAGFGSTVTLGGFGTIRDDPTVVVRVTPAGLPERPPVEARLRLRGTSFDRYDGRRWSRSTTGAVRLRGGGSRYAVVRWPDPARDPAVAVRLEPLDEPIVFLPEGTVGLEVPGALRFGVERSRSLHLGDGLEVRHDGGAGLAYTAYVAATPEPPPRLDEEARARHLTLPGGVDAVARLAREWTAGATTDAERVARIVSRLRDSGEYRYSLRLPEVGAGTPLDVFLLTARAGHCEYFSTAAAIMLRTLAVPTRNVTGFVGGRFNPYGRYYALRQGDAHSWVEAYVEGRGWVTVDPTPAARDAAGPRPGLLGGLAALLDALRTRWQDQVVNYDLRSQTGLLNLIRARVAGDGPRPRAAAGAAPRGADERPTALARARPLVLTALAALLVIAVVRRRRRGAAPAVPPTARATRDLYLRLERRLARRGVPRPAGRTPTEHAAWLAASGWPGADDAARVTAAYVAARYGGEPPSPGELAELRRRVARL